MFVDFQRQGCFFKHEVLWGEISRIVGNAVFRDDNIKRGGILKVLEEFVSLLFEMWVDTRSQLYVRIHIKEEDRRNYLSRLDEIGSFFLICSLRRKM